MSYVATNLGHLSGGSGSQAFGVSATGGVAVGWASDSDGNRQPVYWDASNVLHELPTLNGGGIDQGFGCSGDGSVIVGQSDNGGLLPLPAVWTGGPSWTVTELSLLAGTTVGSATCCSADGAIIFGWCAASGGALLQPCVWVNRAISALPGTAGRASGSVNGCSPSGAVAVGFTYETHVSSGAKASYEVTVWSGSWTATVLPSPAGGVVFGGDGGLDAFAAATGCSGDGSIVVGTSLTSNGLAVVPIYWNPGENVLGSTSLENSGFFGDVSGVFAVDGLGSVYVNFSVYEVLSPLAGGSGTSTLAISSDATAVVGYGNNSSSQATAIRWTWSGPPIPGAGGPPTQGSGPVPILPVRFLICEPTDWTLTQPVQTVYGLDHLAGMYVIGLADGVLIGPLLVSSDGAVTLPFPASAIILGMSFTPQVQTTDLDAGTPTIQGRRKDILAVTARVKSSLGVQVGSNQPDGAALDPPQNAPAWSGMQTIPIPPQSPSYTSPSGQLVTLPLTGDLYASIPGAWDVPGQVAIQGTPGQPLYVLAVIPEILEGDTVEQTYAKAPEGRRERSQKGQRAVPGNWMLSGE